MSDKGRSLGKPNVLHLRQLITAAQSVRQEAAEIGLDLEKMPRQLREKLLGPNLWWAWVYGRRVTYPLNLWHSVSVGHPR
jgi:hypothetical protein